MPSRRTSVHSISLLHYTPPVAQLELEVGSGTYVRAIADALGGHCQTLRRTAVGPFRVEDADEDRLLSPLEVLPFLPELVLLPHEVGRVMSGQVVERQGDGRARLTFDGKLVAVARLGGGLARPETVFTKGLAP
jgi:tRNA pseudouridine55 synthase